MRLLAEHEHSGTVACFPGDGAALVAFLSFAVSRGFGATHPLIALADRLHAVHRVPMGPLTTFYEAAEEDAEDAEKRELTWQPRDELAAALSRLIEAVEGDEQCRVLLRRANASELPAQARALLAFVNAAPARSRVRLGYEL